jgi:hypothetical protein
MKRRKWLEKIQIDNHVHCTNINNIIKFIQDYKNNLTLAEKEWIKKEDKSYVPHVSIPNHYFVLYQYDSNIFDLCSLNGCSWIPSVSILTGDFIEFHCYNPSDNLLDILIEYYKTELELVSVIIDKYLRNGINTDVFKRKIEYTLNNDILCLDSVKSLISSINDEDSKYYKRFKNRFPLSSNQLLNNYEDTFFLVSNVYSQIEKDIISDNDNIAGLIVDFSYRDVVDCWSEYISMKEENGIFKEKSKVLLHGSGKTI